MRHLSETPLAGTEGHLRRVNKGNPALHHHDYRYKPAHPTILEAPNVAEPGLTFKRLFSPTLGRAYI